jgi:hypothetical protein
MCHIFATVVLNVQAAVLLSNPTDTPQSNIRTIISPDNAIDLEQVVVFGMGTVDPIAWSGNGEWVVVGVWLGSAKIRDLCGVRFLGMMQP